ncbi:MAG: hypothetical protein V3V47_04395 [Desulfobacteria bacterium]
MLTHSNFTTPREGIPSRHRIKPRHTLLAWQRNGLTAGSQDSTLKADRIGGLSDGDDLQSRQDVVRQVTWPRNSIHVKSSPFEELLRATMFEQEATRRVLVKKGLLTNEEVLEEINVVRREMEGNGGCGGNNYKGNL